LSTDTDIPGFQEFMIPVLEVLEAKGMLHRLELRDEVMKHMKLTPAQIAETMGKRGRGRAASRVHWAFQYLSEAGATKRPKRGYGEITDRGRALLASHSGGIKVSDLKTFKEFQDWAKRTATKAEARVSQISSDDQEIDPVEQLQAASERLQLIVAADLLDRLRHEEPEFLERAVLRLLQAMGYGGSEEDTQHLGGSGDGGLDGVIRQDALGLEQVYVQAKRYAPDNRVGRKEIQSFVGALTGIGASAGVFITTSSFSSEAKEYVKNLSPRVILIDGDELATNMIDYGVGVTTTREFKTVEIDENFFTFFT
jgi:restriction system protein